MLFHSLHTFELGYNKDALISSSGSGYTPKKRSRARSVQIPHEVRSQSRKTPLVGQYLRQTRIATRVASLENLAELDTQTKIEEQAQAIPPAFSLG